MSLPEAVQAQVEEANRLQAQISAPDEPVEHTTPSDPPVEARQTPTATPDFSAETDWEHKYRSEIGRFKAEADRAREAAQNAWQQIEQMRAELDALKSKPKDPEPEHPAPSITDQDVETFGSDLVEFAQRAAAKVASDQLKLLRAEMQGLYKALDEVRNQVGQVGSTAQYSVEQVFYDKLTQRVPDWQAINQDQAWFDWLSQTDAFSGAPRQALLNDARAKLDIERVVQFFEAFKGVSPSVAKPKASAELQRQVSPPKSRAGSSAPTQGDKKVWTEAEITKFYEAKALGRIDPQEAARMEADLNQAVAEGRVR